MKHYVRIPWEEKTYRVRVIDAKPGSDWEFTIDELDNTNGKRGHEDDCVMANGAIRERALCKSYKVIGWVMSRTRALGVIAVNDKREPTKVVRFIHYKGNKQRAFDEGGTFKPGDTVTLHAPHGRDRLGRRPRSKRTYKATGTRPQNRPSKLERVAFTRRSRSVIKWAEMIVAKQGRERSRAVERLVADAQEEQRA